MLAGFPRCSSGSVAMNWIAIGIAGSCFLGLVLGFQNAALEAHQNLPGECPATVSQIGIGGKSTAKTCRTFRTSWSLRTCAGLQPLKAISKFEKASVFPCWNIQHNRGFSSRRKSQNPNPAQLQEEHAGILGLDGFPKAPEIDGKFHRQKSPHSLESKHRTLQIGRAHV